MTAPELYREAVRRGLRLAPAGDKLAVAPKGACPRDFADVLRQHKAELLDWLNCPPRPGWGSVPLDGLLLKVAAPVVGSRQRELVVHFVLRQRAVAGWLARREAAYFAGPGRHWDCGTIRYAAARDAACYQLRCSEPALWETLDGLDSGFRDLRKEAA